ncbi:MAG: hypothetical protein ACI8WB_004965 [Phenylobacterium sp.]|jgi:hypothetical protein
MATLLNLENNEQTNLLALHLVGRHPQSCNTILNNPKASRVHATISWDGESWSIQDNSSNGTWVNDTRLQPNTSQTLNPTDKINFANPNAGTWEMQDISPPKSMLVPLTAGASMIVLEGIVVLPSEESPQITLYLSPDGHWFCENEMGTSMLLDGNKVGIPGMFWRFVEASGCDETIQIEAQASGISELAIDFAASQDEEHVSIVLTMDSQQFDLGERNHHYLLLLLARKYLEDKAEGFTTMEQGWIEKDALIKMLNLDEIHINMQIYRFRKQVLKALPQHLVFPQMIERRKGAIRFVCDNVRIKGGMQ